MQIHQTQFQTNSKDFKQKPQIQSFKLILKSSLANPKPPQPQPSNTILNPNPPQSSICGHKPQRKPNPIDPDHLTWISSSQARPAWTQPQIVITLCSNKVPRAPHRTCLLVRVTEFELEDWLQHWSDSDYCCLWLLWP